MAHPVAGIMPAMTDRGLPIVDGAPACPFVAFEDERDERSTRPDHRHRCFAEARPAPRALAHQEAYCLSPAFPACPTFQDWARREAAVPRAPLRSEPDEGIRPTVRRSRRDWAAPPPWLSGEPGGRSTRSDEEDEDVVPGAADAAAAAAQLGFLTPARVVASTGAGATSASSPERPSATADREAGAVSRDRVATHEPAVEASPLDRRRSGESANAMAGGLAASAAAWLGAESVTDDALEEADADDREALVPVATPGRVPRRSTADPEARWTAEPRRTPIAHGAVDARRTPDRRADAHGAASARRDGGQTVHGPEWEEPHVREAYPTLRAPVVLPNLSRVGLGFIALVIAAVVLFFVPPMLLKLGAAGDAGPTDTPAPSVAPSASLAPTPVPQATPFVYTVKENDTLVRIAARYKTTVSDILAANPQIKDQNKLAIGDQITIPTPASSTVVGATTVPDVTTVPAASASAP